MIMLDQQSTGQAGEAMAPANAKSDVNGTSDAIQKVRAIETHSQQAQEFADSYRELNVDSYQSCFAYSRHRLEQWLHRYLPENGEGLRLLDVGCGTGHHMASLRQRGFEVAGVDGSAEMLEQARANNPGVEIKQADVESIPFADASFDFVLCVEVLRYLPQISSCLQEMARVLKPGGICLATAAPLWSLNGYPIVNRAAGMMPLGNLVRLKQFFTTSRDLRRECRKAGFIEPMVHGVYFGPVNWVEHLAPSSLPNFLRSWEPLDNKVANNPIGREFSNMFLLRAVREG
jgi:ubiquinone/menaquinone biosynthesis C-methylase UbiE